MMLRTFRVDIPFSVKNLSSTLMAIPELCLLGDLNTFKFCLISGILICLGMQIEVHHVCLFFLLVSFRLPPSYLVYHQPLSLPTLSPQWGTQFLLGVCDLSYSPCHPYLKHSKKCPFLSSQLLADSASSCLFYKDLTGLWKDEMFPNKQKKDRWLVS